ncbi:uncharacterized protein LOC115229375 isoform X1 [Octopus sinensis]|uniref:Uncharacterized protein LOC115229375 isoform X1 n=1 Tax=Octopus sinensis TaxID=2607531 RepID=A0A7E6EID7_9MOLL|nr:uncharacterized protein LOC115229375 isoform X1 [Octopus sinensis]
MVVLFDIENYLYYSHKKCLILNNIPICITFYFFLGVKRNKETSSAKGTEDNYATISDEALSAENNYATIPDEALNAARANAISSKPNTNEEQYAEASGPSYLELKPADMKISYVNVSRKPDVVEEQCAEVSEPKYLEMGQRNTDGTYVNVSKKPADGTYVNVSKNLLVTNEGLCSTDEQKEPRSFQN